MTTSFPIGRVLGIPIRIHVSWFAVFFLVAGSKAFELERIAPLPLAIAAGVVAALLLFASVLLHELGHCVLARAFGIHVRQIQLFLFGGVAEILGEPKQAIDEVLIAAAGPAVSLLLGGLILLPTRLFLESGSLAYGVFSFLGGANVILFAFNLVPAFPTDGGRILRALLFGATGDFRLATKIAAGVGMAFAAILILVGAALGLFGTPSAEAGRISFGLGGAWLAMIGIFLGKSALAGVKQAELFLALQAARVSEIMVPVRAPVDGGRTLFAILTESGGPSAAEMLLGFAVSDGSALSGFVDGSTLVAVARERWSAVTARELMSPLSAFPVMSPASPLDELVRAFFETGATVALVFDGPALVGYAGRGEVGRWMLEP